MTSTIVDPATGTGSQTLGGYRDVTDVICRLIVPSDLTNFYGTGALRRTYNAGWFGFAFSADGTWDFDRVCWWSFLDIEAVDLPVDTVRAGQPDLLIWSFQPGVECYLEAFYP